MRDLNYMIEVMTAARDGKPVEVLCDDGVWRAEPCGDKKYIPWNWGCREYRIAQPKPREWWLMPATAFGTGTMLASPVEPVSCCDGIHVREVLP